MAKRFSVAPISAGMAVGVGDALILYLLPMIVDLTGKPREVPALLRDLYRLAETLYEFGMAPWVLGIGVAVIGIVSVMLLPLLRYFWWIFSLLTFFATALLLLLIIRAAYTIGA